MELFTKRRPAFAVCMVLVLLCIWWTYKEAAWLLLPVDSAPAIRTEQRITSWSRSRDFIPTNDPTSKSLYPGELPGYTGWARPSTTLAGSFRLDSQQCTTHSIVGRKWTCSVHCAHAECLAGSSLFYLRAYGPAILPGLLIDHRNGTYDVTFLPMDAGVYTVEVVLTFSKAPPFDTFPLELNAEPAYEGYMIPGFPLILSVIEHDGSTLPTPVTPALPLCNKKQLLETSPTSAVETGRWLVTDKVINQEFALAETNIISVDGYISGENSLGVALDYYPTECSLLDDPTFKSPTTTEKCRQHQIEPGTVYNILFVGDSNLQFQQSTLAAARALEGIVFSNYISTKNGLHPKLDEIRNEIQRAVVKGQQHEQQFGQPVKHIVVFNSGLHDIVFLCGHEYFGIKSEYFVRPSAPCVDTYRATLKELVQAVQGIPFVAATVFQSTTAAWPKWGNYGVSWPVNATQPMPFASDFAHHFNDIAWEIMVAAGIPVMDAYWMTLSRPDHREVTAENKLSDKMAHAGTEVYSVLVRKLVLLVILTICPSLVGQ